MSPCIFLCVAAGPRRRGSLELPGGARGPAVARLVERHDVRRRWHWLGRRLLSGELSLRHLCSAVLSWSLFSIRTRRPRHLSNTLHIALVVYEILASECARLTLFCQRVSLGVMRLIFIEILESFLFDFDINVVPRSVC